MRRGHHEESKKTDFFKDFKTQISILNAQIWHFCAFENNTGRGSCLK